MGKLSLPIFVLLLVLSYQSWALQPCPSSGYFHNCFGTYLHFNGDKYVGEYKNNKRHGLGSYYYYADGVNKGDVYTGEYKDNKKHGQGTYTFSTGDKYEGEYKNGKRHGQGTYTYPNGDKYVGEYKDDKRNGQGTYHYNNGIKDVGEFKNSLLNGFAIRYDKYGNILKSGIWKDDKFLYSKKKSSPSNSNSKLEGYKNFCKEIGFTPGTQRFGECVMKVLEKG